MNLGADHTYPSSPPKKHAIHAPTTFLPLKLSYALPCLERCSSEPWLSAHHGASIMVRHAFTASTPTAPLVSIRTPRSSLSRQLLLSLLLFSQVLGHLQSFVYLLTNTLVSSGKNYFATLSVYKFSITCCQRSPTMKSFALTASAALLLSQVQANQFVMYTGTTVDNGDDNAVERADPIIAPGILSQHVHQIFGSNGFAPGVTYESLQKSSCTTVGAANGDSNIADKSIYWHPALFAEASDDSGYIRIPTLGHKFYYKDAGSGTKREPFEFPQGFRMLAGNPFMRAPGDLPSQNITQWVCHASSGWNQGTAGGFPDDVTDCDQYPGFNGAIHFPHCWNGADFNPADPTVSTKEQPLFLV